MTDNSSFSLGSAHGSIIIDVSNVSSAIAEAQRAFQNGIANMGQNLERFGQQLTNVGLAITKLTAPMSAFIVTGVKVAASFEDIMTQVKVFGGVTDKELNKVRDQVLKWGKDTVFSAQDAGEAMLNLLKVGLSVKDATAAMPAVLQLATVGNISLAQASDIVTQSMNQYGLKAKDTKRITDALAKGANASAADVADLGQALGNVGPIAKQYGLSIEDTVAILSVFANNGIKGAEAGTQLKSMLTNMGKASKPAREAWKALNVSLYDAQGKMRPLNTVIKEINKSLKNMTPEQQNKIIHDLAGSYGQLGLTALLAQNGIDKMSATMKAAPGGAAVADASVGTFNRALESLRGSIETLQIQVLTPFMDNVLKPLVNQFILIVNAATTWAQANPALANTIIMIGAALSGLGPVLMVAGMAIGAIGTVIGFILSPVGLLIGAVALLAAAFINNWGGIRDIVAGAWTAIKPILEQLEQWFLFDALPAIRNFIATSVIPIIQRFTKFISDIWTVVQPALNSLWQWFYEDALPKILNFITTQAIPKVSEFIGFLINIWDQVEPKLIALLKWFTEEGLPAIGNFINDFMTNIVDPLIQILQDVWRLVQPFLEDLRKWFVETALPAINQAIADFKTNFLEPAIKMLSGIWESVKDGLKQFADWFHTHIPEIQEAIRTAAQLIGDKINEIVTFIGGLITKVSDFFGGVIRDAQNAINKVKEFFGMSGQKSTEIGNVTVGQGGFQLTPRDSGGFLPAGMGALVGKGAQPEAFFSTGNTMGVPNFDKVLAGMGGNGITIQSLTIQADTYEGGRAAARGLEDQIAEWRARKGM